MKEKLVDEILNQLYYIEHNYDGIQKLTKKAKQVVKGSAGKLPAITQKEVADWLKKQNTYQLNYVKPTKKSDFLPIYSESFSAWQIDLTFIPQYKVQNNGNYVLFTAIHINSRFAYASFATNKKASTILRLMKVFVKKFNPTQIDGDKGSEFINKFFISYLQEEEIGYQFFISNSHKLGIINRFHRTLKDKIQKYITASGKTKWTSVIDDIINSYNTTYHRGIEATPTEVFNSELLQSLIIDDKKAATHRLKNKEKPFEVGDFIRIELDLKQFENKMTAKNSTEIYQIVKIKTNSVDAKDEQEKIHTFKKSKVMKIDENVENRKEDTSKAARKVNRDIRLIRKEDLIQAPTATRTRPSNRRVQQIK